jgi:hypothetical protein
MRAGINTRLEAISRQPEGCFVGHLANAFPAITGFVKKEECNGSDMINDT